MSAEEEVTDAMVTAALAELTDLCLDLGATARVADYLHDGQTPEERREGIQRMQAMDLELEQERRDTVRAALVAALEAR